MNINGLYIDRKMIGILSIFVFVGMILIIALIVATNALSALRAYSTLQTHWTESRKDAAYELVRFLDTDETVHLDHFNKDLSLIRHATIVYDELNSESPNMPVLHKNLILAKTHPRDVDNMIKVFERFHSIEHLSNAVDAWDAANRAIAEMEILENELRTAAKNGTAFEHSEEEYLLSIMQLDSTMNEQKNAISIHLSEGSKLVTNIIFGISLTIGSIFLISGFYFSYRFLRRIKEWARMMDISEQRYKSLFEQNPNIVFSLTADGRLKSGNEAFFKLSNIETNEILAKHFKDFPIGGFKNDFRKYFKQALKGKANNLELLWQEKPDSNVQLQATMLPIQVNDQTEGVFVIAEDITFKKFAQEKIKSQLQEKISLLGEVHDRVKNNLALISSFLHLQEEYLDDESSKKYIESTISRIQSLAMIHERIYHAENFSSVRMEEFVEDLIVSVKKNHPEVSEKVDVIIQTNRVTLDIRQAIPCGLLLNELVHNAFKYAFIGKNSGTLWVVLEEEGGNNVTLSIRDDGAGLPPNFKLAEQNTLGFTMVRLLAQQLDGKPVIKGKGGLDFRLHFKSKLSVKKSA